MKTWASKKLKDFVHEQTVDCSNVRAKQQYAKGKFYLVSCAGVIEYTATTERDIARFRDRWINRFEAIRNLDLVDQNPAFFRLYKEIRDTEKIKFRANLRTRACYLRRLN